MLSKKEYKSKIDEMFDALMTLSEDERNDIVKSIIALTKHDKRKRLYSENLLKISINLCGMDMRDCDPIVSSQISVDPYELQKLSLLKGNIL